MWPTPTAHPDNSNKNGKFKNPTLGDAVRDRETWPTPTASDWKGRGPNSKQQGLSEVVKYPTPTYGKLAGGTGGFNQIEELYSTGQVTLEEKKAMQAGNGGRLNPTWVEWLMGFPTGWTDLED
jgi:DNA (cytosine-5)-methyltransferase 1